MPVRSTMASCWRTADSPPLDVLPSRVRRPRPVSCAATLRVHHFGCLSNEPSAEPSCLARPPPLCRAPSSHSTPLCAYGSKSAAPHSTSPMVMAAGRCAATSVCWDSPSHCHITSSKTRVFAGRMARIPQPSPTTTSRKATSKQRTRHADFELEDEVRQPGRRGFPLPDRAGMIDRQSVTLALASAPDAPRHSTTRSRSRTASRTCVTRSNAEPRQNTLRAPKVSDEF